MAEVIEEVESRIAISELIFMACIIFMSFIMTYDIQIANIPILSIALLAISIIFMVLMWRYVCNCCSYYGKRCHFYFGLGAEIFERRSKTIKGIAFVKPILVLVLPISWLIIGYVVFIYMHPEMSVFAMTGLFIGVLILAIINGLLYLEFDNCCFRGLTDFGIYLAHDLGRPKSKVEVKAPEGMEPPKPSIDMEELATIQAAISEREESLREIEAIIKEIDESLPDLGKKISDMVSLKESANNLKLSVDSIVENLDKLTENFESYEVSDLGIETEVEENVEEKVEEEGQ